MSELPKGWTSTPLGEAGEWIGGGTPSKSKAAFWTDGSIPWISPKDMKRLRIDDAEDHITDAAVAGSSVKPVPKGAIIMVTRSGILAHSVPVAIAEADVTVNQDLKAIAPCEAVESEYLLLSLRALENHFLTTCRKHGTTVSSLDTDRLKKTELPLPPLPEQRRIVAKLDRLSARSAAARDHLARTTKLAARAKQAVLARMIDDLSMDHQEIGAAIASLDQGWSPKCEARPAADSSEWGVIKTTAIQAVSFDGSENKALPPALQPRPALQIRRGDVLITRAGPRSRVGIACVVKGVRQNLMLCDKAYRLKTDPNRATPTYLTYLLNSPASLRQLEELKTGISDSGLNLTQKRFLALRGPLPPINIQSEIVGRIETAFARIDRLTEEAARAAHLLDRLDERLLAKAFRGELVPQDPDDEPAEALLARIRNARASAPRPKRGRRS